MPIRHSVVGKVSGHENTKQRNYEDNMQQQVPPAISHFRRFVFSW